jgi:hypothetical protein
MAEPDKQNPSIESAGTGWGALATALRITLEFVLAVFRVAWYVEQVASHTEVVSKEIPRFGALGSLLFGKGGPRPPAPKP